MAKIKKEDADARKRVLIVDDDLSMIKMLSSFLDNLKYEVFSASGGKAAVKIASTVELDVILLDVYIPGTVGMETLLDLFDYSEAKIIMMTGFASDNLRRHAKSLGAMDLLKKPLDLKKLEDLLKKIP